MAKAVFVGVEPMTREHIWAPLEREFKINNWETVFCNNGSTLGDIGFYCEDSSLPGNQEFTVITINGLDQDHVIRPKYTRWFSQENWGLFDLGLLPGPRWFNGWVTRTPRLRNTPRLGVISTGWFKGDDAVKKYSRPDGKNIIQSVLYAPQTEQDGKQKTVLAAVLAAELKLKIKHWENEAYIDIHPDLLTPSYMRNLASENRQAEQYENVEVVPSRANFMEVLADVDLLITDQSSVLYEAAMLNIPTLTCIGWKHACGDCLGPQPSPDITISVHPDELESTLRDIKEQYSNLLEKTKLIRANNFAFLGNSARITFDSVVDIRSRANKRSLIYKCYLFFMPFFIQFRLKVRHQRKALKLAIRFLLALISRWMATNKN